MFKLLFGKTLAVVLAASVASLLATTCTEWSPAAAVSVDNQMTVGRHVLVAAAIEDWDAWCKKCVYDQYGRADYRNLTQKEQYCIRIHSECKDVL